MLSSPRPVSACLVAIVISGSVFAQETPAPIDFAKHVQPILENRCYRCHGGKKTEGEFDLTSRATVFHAEEALWSVVPKDPDASILFERITLAADDPDLMPEGGERLPDAEIETLRRWIAAGAEWPADVELVGEAPPPIDIVEVPLMDYDAAMAVEQAMVGLAADGAVAQRVAQTTAAVDVSFAVLGKAADDAMLARLRPLAPALVWLNLSRTAVTDSGMAAVAQLPHLRRLHLAGTAVTDAGLVHVQGLGELQFLNLYGTAITDAGLAHLRGLSGLRKLYLWQTKVTDGGVQALQEALPNLQVDRGDYLPTAMAPKPQPVNTECPVTGKPLPEGDPGQFAVLHQGQWVGFCCAKCRQEFESDPAKYESKVPQVALQVVNQKCPVSGEPADASITVEHGGRVIAFCCAKCKAAFEKDPARYLAALDAPPALGPELNEICPVAGQPAKPQIFVDHEGLRIAFCCEKCKAKFEADPAAYRPKLVHPGLVESGKKAPAKAP